MAGLWQSAGQPERAAAVWRSVADARDLTDGTLADDTGVPRSARREAARRLGALTRRPAADDSDPADGRLPPMTRPPAPDAAPLPWPLESAWHVRVPPGREWPLTVTAVTLVLGAKGAIVARSLPDGREHWRRPLPFTPRWVGTVPGAMVVAGPHGAARVRAADGGLVWTFAPSAAFAGPQDSSPGWQAADADPAPAAELSAFQLAGGRLFALEGSARLLALDLDSGEPLWRRPAPAAGLPHAVTGDRFHAGYLATAEFVLAQSTDGRRWNFDATTGRIMSVAPTAEEPWPTPVPLDDRRVVIAEATDSGEPRMALLDLAAGTEVWRYELPRWPSLSHELPRFRRDGDVLLLCVGRNYGTELERLDCGTGRPLSEALLLGRDSIGPESVTVIGDLTVVAAGGTLRALTPDGSERWSRPLDLPGDWRLLRAGGSVVLACPAQAVPQGVGFAWRVAAYDATGGDLLKQWDWYPRGPRASVAAGTGLAAMLDGEALGLTATGRGVK
jgi:outer membrane protein assembly factor BamB